MATLRDGWAEGHAPVNTDHFCQSCTVSTFSQCLGSTAAWFCFAFPYFGCGTWNYSSSTFRSAGFSLLLSIPFTRSLFLSVPLLLSVTLSTSFDQNYIHHYLHTCTYEDAFLIRVIHAIRNELIYFNGKNYLSGIIDIRHSDTYLRSFMFTVIY